MYVLKLNSIFLHPIAAVEVLSYQPDDYFKTQQSWKQEVWEHNEKVKGEDNSICDQTMLIKQRKQELKHALDVKELYEKVSQLLVPNFTTRRQSPQYQQNMYFF